MGAPQPGFVSEAKGDSIGFDLGPIGRFSRVTIAYLKSYNTAHIMWAAATVRCSGCTCENNHRLQGAWQMHASMPAEHSMVVGTNTSGSCYLEFQNSGGEASSTTQEAVHKFKVIGLFVRGPNSFRAASLGF